MAYNQHSDGRFNCTSAVAHNASLPVHSLPAELLLCIFELYVQRHQSKGYYQQLKGLSKVCTRWRNLIQSSPTLWTTISPAEPKHVIALALERSSNLPLDVVNRAEQNATDWGDLSSFLAYLQPHSGRLKSFDLVAIGRSVGPMVDFLRHPMPLLEKLKLFGILSPRITPVQLFQDKAPRLMDITLSGITLRWEGGSFHGLKSLDISWTPLPSPATILTILSNSPQIQKLEIRRCTVDTSDTPSLPYITVPCLTFLSLELGQPQLVIPVIDRIQTEKRCSFRTDLQESSTLNDVAALMKKWLQKLGIGALPSGEGVTINISAGGIGVKFHLSDNSAPFSLHVEVRYPADQLVPVLACFNDLLGPIKGSTTARLELVFRRPTLSMEPLIDEVFRSPPVTSLELVDGVEFSFSNELLIPSLQSTSAVFGQLRNLTIRTGWMGMEIHEALLAQIKATNNTLRDRSGEGLERVEIHVTLDPDGPDIKGLSDSAKRLHDFLGIRTAFVYVDDSNLSLSLG